MTRTTILALGALMLLGGCGKKTMLKPADGHVLPVKAKTAAGQPSVADLLNPGTQARPTRSNEILSKSKPLEPDRFDLPPPG
jgi:hypothetical protein